MQDTVAVSPAAGMASVALAPHEIHRESKPVDLANYFALRGKVLSALETARDRKVPARDAMVALAQALTDAPGSPVLAIELARATDRAGDRRRALWYTQLAQQSALDQASVAKPLAALIKRVQPEVDAMVRGERSSESGARAALKLNDVAGLDSVCDWIKEEFSQGRPPVDDVGQQGTNVLECQLLARFALTPEIEAAPVVLVARGRGSRVFAWIAARAKSTVWLSHVVAESFSPEFHPDGNGFTVELQRTAAYRANNPELTAYVFERRAVIDVALNEQYLRDQHRISVMTFDLDPPRMSAPVVLHASTGRSLVDPNDKALPKGYRHSPDIGSSSDETFKLEWGDDRVRLTLVGQATVRPKEQILFGQ